jgi:hypothetical protein
MVIVLHPEQAAEVEVLADELQLSRDEIVKHLLSGPLSLFLDKIPA